MYSKLVNEIGLQKKLPIIGKGNAQDIINKFQRLNNENYSIIEITLRSEEALQTAINLKQKYPNIKIGLGSIKSVNDLIEVSNYNFDFYISPGINKKMLDYSNKNNIFLIPGVSSSSEILTAIEYDLRLLKYFHAEINGGVDSLKVLKDIFQDIRFIPTGGINMSNQESYLSLENVIAVGSTNF